MTELKKLFPEYFLLTTEEQQRLWEDSIFVLDTNVLLRLYGYSENTRELILRLFEARKNQLFIPYQVCHEFVRNRIKIIQDEVDRYGTTRANLRDVVASLKSDNRHPFVENGLNERFIKIAEELETAINDGEKSFEELKKIDTIRDRIATLVEGQIGAPTPEAELQAIYLEGKSRYDNKIPPGYEDIIKPEPDRYGDLIIWRNIMQEAKRLSKPVVFITDDDKDDWWLKYKKKKFSPRTELIKEFHSETSLHFWMYSTERFVQFEKNRTDQRELETVVHELKSANKERESVASATKLYQGVFERSKLHINNASIINELRQRRIELRKEREYLMDELLNLRLRRQAAEMQIAASLNPNQEIAPKQEINDLKLKATSLRQRVHEIDNRLQQLRITLEGFGLTK